MFYIKQQIGGDDFIANRSFILDQATLNALSLIRRARVYLYFV